VRIALPVACALAIAAAPAPVMAAAAGSTPAVAVASAAARASDYPAARARAQARAVLAQRRFQPTALPSPLRSVRERVGSALRRAEPTRSRTERSGDGSAVG